MEILRAKIFQNYPEVIFGFSTKIGLNRKEPFYFNLSLSVGDDRNIVKENRMAFAKELGLDISQIAFQKQIHSDIISSVENAGVIGESDAMITTKKNLGLAISSADCTPIFIYDKNNSIIAAVHSGWRGTEQKILFKTIDKLIKEFNSEPKNLIIYIGPSIHQKNYEVGEEVAIKFESKYLLKIDNKIYLNVLRANVDQIKKFEIPDEQIEISPLCSFEEKNLLHSYRRDGIKSGRSLGIIAIKG
ncbi:MAG: peptidoglycan editing factor PgeF [Melioribacteraceae bacterium]|nr:peptidoglycan editing factor PgeF [Melioribacteraceae bacterium]